MQQFALATIGIEGRDQAALVVEGKTYRLDRLGGPAAGLRPLMEDWDHLFARAAASAGRTWRAMRRKTRSFPTRSCSRRCAIRTSWSAWARSIRTTSRNSAFPPERWAKMPIFLRAPTVSIVGPGRAIRIPPRTKEFDWEIELAVIVGKRLSKGTEAEAQKAIAGYSIGIDFTCRDLLDRGAPAGVDLVCAKAQDGMAPLGPVLMPAAFVGDVQDLALKLWVNGEQRQDGTTASMLFPVYEQLAEISQYITLEPGDVIFTGSPAGSAEGEDQFLKGGNHVRAEIEKIGVLDLELVAPSEESAVAA